MFPVREMNMDTSLRVFCGPHIPDPRSTGKSTTNTGSSHVHSSSSTSRLRSRAPKCTRRSRRVRSRTSGLNSRRRTLRSVWQRAMNPSACSTHGTARWRVRATRPHRFQRSRDGDGCVLVPIRESGCDELRLDLRLSSTSRTTQISSRRCAREQYRVRGIDLEKPVTLEMLEEMPYLRTFVKESLRGDAPSDDGYLTGVISRSRSPRTTPCPWAAW